MNHDSSSESGAHAPPAVRPGRVQLVARAAHQLDRFGAGHGMDLYMIFRNIPPYLVFDDAGRALSDQLLAVWARIAKTGDAGRPVCMATGREQTILDTQIHPVAVASARCDFWWPMLRKRPQKS